ncbi:hypothetical protein [Geodermatophilus sp. SYSU D01105]
MNTWVQRGLRTALLTGGLLAAGAGVAAADENDVTANVLGVTATVPVEDGAVLHTPVVTGTGEDLTVGDGAGDGLVLPVDTNTSPGTTVLGDAGSGGLSAPVRVTEDDDAPPDPTDGLAVTVPVGTSGGGTAGTTVTVPVATGDLGDVLDGDPSTGTAVDVDLTDPVVPGPGGSGVLLDLEDAVSVGDDDPATGRDPVLEVPVSVDGDRPTTVGLPVPGTEDDGPLSGDSIEVDLGGLLGDDGTVVAVPVDGGGAGTGSDLLVRVTLPIGLPGLWGGADGADSDDGHGTGQGDGIGSGTGSGSGRGDGSGQGDGSGPGTGTGSGSGSGQGDGPGTGNADGPAPDSGAPGTGDDGTGASGSGTGDTSTGGTSTGGTDGDCAGTGRVPGTAGGGTSPRTGPAPGGPSAGGAPGSDPGRAGPATADACGTGSAPAAATRPASTTAAVGGPLTASAGLLVAAGLLLAAGRGRLWRDPVRR